MVLPLVSRARAHSQRWLRREATRRQSLQQQLRLRLPRSLPRLHAPALVEMRQVLLSIEFSPTFKPQKMAPGLRWTMQLHCQPILVQLSLLVAMLVVRMMTRMNFPVSLPV